MTDTADLTEQSRDAWQEAKIKYADAGQKLRDLNRDWKLSERYHDLQTRLKHAEYKSSSLASGEFRRQFEMSVAYHSMHPEHINDRLHELDQEWAAETVWVAATSGGTIAGSLLALLKGRHLLMLTLASNFLLLKGITTGHSPMIAFLRRAGFRTKNEIEQERYALKALRGDFADVEPAEGHGPDESTATGRLHHAVAE